MSKFTWHKKSESAHLSHSSTSVVCKQLKRPGLNVLLCGAVSTQSRIDQQQRTAYLDSVHSLIVALQRASVVASLFCAPS